MMLRSSTILIALCLFQLPTNALAEVIFARNDGYIQFSGSNGFETVTDGEAIGTHRSGGSNVRHGFYEFDLTDFHFPADATLQTASLQLELTAPISNTRTEAELAFYGYTSDGVITASDYDSPASNVDNLLTTDVFPARAESPPSGSLLEVELQNLEPLRAAISAGDRYFTIRSETINFVTLRVGSLENETAVPPSLVITTDQLRGDFNGDGRVDILDIDEIVFADASYDLTDDGVTDSKDLDLLVSTLVGTWFGDSTGDGQFETGDLVSVFSSGKFETGESADWTQGDWNKDGVFDTQDFVRAFSDGGFERGRRSAIAPKAGVAARAAAVPEPQSSLLVLVGMFLIGSTRRIR